jgi:hypothetical protein
MKLMKIIKLQRIFCIGAKTKFPVVIQVEVRNATLPNINKNTKGFVSILQNYDEEFNSLFYFY